MWKIFCGLNKNYGPLYNSYTINFVFDNELDGQRLEEAIKLFKETNLEDYNLFLELKIRANMVVSKTLSQQEAREIAVALNKIDVESQNYRLEKIGVKSISPEEKALLYMTRPNVTCYFTFDKDGNFPLIPAGDFNKLFNSIVISLHNKDLNSLLVDEYEKILDNKNYVTMIKYFINSKENLFSIVLPDFSKLKVDKKYSDIFALANDHIKYHPGTVYLPCVNIESGIEYLKMFKDISGSENFYKLVKYQENGG